MHPADVRDVRQDVWGRHATSSPGRFSLALEVGQEKRPGDEVGRHEALRTCFICHVRNETNLVPRAFPLKVGGAGHPFFLGKSPGDEAETRNKLANSGPARSLLRSQKQLRRTFRHQFPSRFQSCELRDGTIDE